MNFLLQFPPIYLFLILFSPSHLFVIKNKKKITCHLFDPEKSEREIYRDDDFNKTTFSVCRYELFIFSSLSYCFMESS